MIIDSHTHYGHSNIFDAGVSEEKLISTMEKNKVDAAIVQPLPVMTAEEARKAHKEIYNLAKKYPGKIYGIASINPHLAVKEVTGEIERCVKEYNFVGIKCHTIGHAVNPMSGSGQLLFGLADRLKVPINVHSGNGMVFASPALNVPMARQFPELKIVIAHSGMQIFLAEAFVAAKECENIYLETSWTPAEDIEWLVKELGSNRVMMGSDVYSDLCYNQHIELEKYKIIDLSEKQKDDCLFLTANSVFSLGL